MDFIIKFILRIVHLTILSALLLLGGLWLSLFLVTDIKRYDNVKPRILRTPLYEAVGTTKPTLGVILGYTFTTIGNNCKQIGKDYWFGATTGKDLNNYASLSGVWTHKQINAFKQGAASTVEKSIK